MCKKMPETTITRSSDQKNAFFKLKIKGHPNRKFWHSEKKREEGLITESLTAEKLTVKDH